MSLAETTQKIQALSGSGDSLGSTVKFTFEEGVIHIDGHGDSNIVSNDDKAADCTINISIADFNDMLTGDLDPMGAFMGGKMTLDGDMGVAMKLQSIFG